jgi:hypothetical protein
MNVISGCFDHLIVRIEVGIGELALLHTTKHTDLLLGQNDLLLVLLVPNTSPNVMSCHALEMCQLVLCSCCLRITTVVVDSTYH